MSVRAVVTSYSCNHPQLQHCISVVCDVKLDYVAIETLLCISQPPWALCVIKRLSSSSV